MSKIKVINYLNIESIIKPPVKRTCAHNSTCIYYIIN